LNAIAGLPVNCGLSDRQQELLFTTDRGGMNKVATKPGANTCQVPVTTADALVEQTGLAPCLLKIDVEGYEKPVLDGAAGLLAERVLALIVELNDSGRQYGFSDRSVHDLIVSRGFSPFRYEPLSRSLVPRDGMNRKGFNTLYVKTKVLADVQKRLAESEGIDLPMGCI
jgi:hypothetical protein